MGTKIGAAVALCALAVIVIGSLTAPVALAGGRGDDPVIYVTGQDLFFDSVITADPLPFRGRFQDLGRQH